jgi:hypothetical protein
MLLMIGTALLLSRLGSAQTDDQASILLRETEASARNTKNWQTEGAEVSQMVHALAGPIELLGASIRKYYR